MAGPVDELDRNELDRGATMRARAFHGTAVKVAQCTLHAAEAVTALQRGTVPHFSYRSDAYDCEQSAQPE
jgi:hypothetical protein